jgi:hypothetical protein
VKTETIEIERPMEEVNAWLRREFLNANGMIAAGWTSGRQVSRAMAEVAESDDGAIVVEVGRGRNFIVSVRSEPSGGPSTTISVTDAAEVAWPWKLFVRRGRVVAPRAMLRSMKRRIEAWDGEGNGRPA